MQTPSEKELPATKEQFELAVILVFERELLPYIDMVEQVGVRLARLERRIRQLEVERG
jgi:hypothetical protein